jgi:RNA polymerase sigma factor (sigma-70 family)
VNTVVNGEGFRETVFALCFRVLRHRQDAEDACQETLLKLARHGPGDADPARLSAWVHQVALRTAIDHRRANLRRKAREEQVAENAGVAEAESALPIAEALASLPEEERTLLVEHFFARKTLRALADERGCSEPAVWKRVEKGKKHLRKVLTAAVPAAVAGMSGFLEAWEEAPEAWTPWRVATAAAVPAVIVAGVALLGFSRREDPAPHLRIGTRPGPTVVAFDVRTLPTAATAPVPAPTLEEAAVVPPYPYELPPRHWPESKREAWLKLDRTRVDMSAEDRLQHELLAELSDKTGVSIRLSPETPAPTNRVTFKVKDLLLKNTLKLLLAQHALDYELGSDGQVWLRPAQGAVWEPDPRYDEIAAARWGLDLAIRIMDGGRTGSAPDPIWNALRSKVFAIPPGQYVLTGLADKVREESGLNLHISVSQPLEDPDFEGQERMMVGRLVELEKEGSTESAALERRALDAELAHLRSAKRRQNTGTRPFAGGRKTLEDHLQAFSATWNVGWAPREGVLLILDPDRAVEELARAREEHRTYLAAAARLEQPRIGATPGSVFRLAEDLSRETGLKVVPSENAWPVSIPASGSTWKSVLDALPGQGLRWVLRDGTIYIDR